MVYFTTGELAANLQLKQMGQIIAEVLGNWQDLKIQLLTVKLLVLFYGSVWQKLGLSFFDFVRQMKLMALISLSGRLIEEK